MNNKTMKLALAFLAGAALSGCANLRSADVSAAEAAERATAAEPPAMVSRPAPSYGSLGGYRYRRLIAVQLPSG